MRYLLPCILILNILSACNNHYVPTDGIYTIADQMPEYQSGWELLSSDIKYAVEQNDGKHTGQYFVSFIVDEAGSIDTVYIIKGLDPFTDSIVRQSLLGTSGFWTPGIKDKMPVKVKVSFQIALD